MLNRLAGVVFDAYSSSLPLPASRPRGGTSPTPSLFDPHNTREGLHGLYALVRYRGSARALELAEASIAAVFEYWNADSGWDGERMLREHGMELGFADTCIRGAARAIGPLVKLYRASGSAPALDLAIALKEKAVGTVLHGGRGIRRRPVRPSRPFDDIDAVGVGPARGPDRRLRPAEPGEGILRPWPVGAPGRSRMGDRDREARRQPGQRRNQQLGRHPRNRPDPGETGSSRILPDAERILRCHLLPSQLRDARFLVEGGAPDKVVGERGRWADSLVDRAVRLHAVRTDMKSR